MPGKAIVVGTLADATVGIGSLLFGAGADQQLAALTLQGVAAIEREFTQSGTAEFTHAAAAMLPSSSSACCLK